MSDTKRDEIEVRGYRLTPVYGNVGADVRDEIVGMWLAAGVLPADEAARRVDEVVFTIRAPSGVLAGVNTVYVRDIPGAGPFYFYRTFVRPSDRGVPGLATRAIKAAIAFLKDHAHPRSPRGLVVVTENPKLMNAGPTARLTRIGLTPLGLDAGDRVVWCVKFDGSVPTAPPGMLKPVS